MAFGIKVEIMASMEKMMSYCNYKKIFYFYFIYNTALIVIMTEYCMPFFGI